MLEATEVEIKTKEGAETITPERLEKLCSYFMKLQQDLCEALEEEDGTEHFSSDIWERSEGGGGITKVLKNGAVIEQAGVNFSHVMGDSLPFAATSRHPGLKNLSFEALGVSSVIHPRNPYVPTAHMNVRFIRALRKDHKDNSGGDRTVSWWFGGGFDLTPYYPFKEDCIHWHRNAALACKDFGPDIYPKFKKWCDDYFYLKHRKEQRGIGGLFFDDLNQWSFEKCFEFIRSVGDHFIKGYRPIMATRKRLPFGEREREFQRYRRGRYVEFNLLYDRGTLFGLQSNGRVESILMSLPPEVRFEYCRQLEAGSPEAELQEYLKRQEWL